MSSKRKIYLSLKKIPKDKIKKKLDIGCGKNPLSLEFEGKITAIDKENLKLPTNVKFIKKNIREFKITEKYDLIIASLILHFMKKNKSIKFIEEIKKHTFSKKYNFIVCLGKKDNGFKKFPIAFYPTLKELENLYKNWNIIDKGDFKTDIEEHDNLPPHNHNIIYILAKKKL